jgi:hypothetical protein
MAIATTISTRLEIAGTDYSAWCKEASIDFGVAVLDKTNFASAGWEEKLAGLKNGTLNVSLMDDFADNDVNEDLFGIFGTVVTFKLRFSSAAISATNPEYQGSVLISSVTGISATVGELPMQDHSWPTTAAVTRAVA